MSDEKTVTHESWSRDFVVPLSDFISQLQALQASVPEEYRCGAMIELDGTDSFESRDSHLSVWYAVPKSAEELREQQARADAREREREGEERQTLARLKAKYEKGIPS